MSLEMLWGSRAEEVVQESFRQAKWNAERERKLEAEHRLDILEDDWEDLLWAKIQEVYQSQRIRDSVKPLISTEHNVLKRITNELATCYKHGAVREVDGNSKAARGLWAEVDIDTVLEAADRYLVALRDLILVPWVDEGRMEVEILTPNRVTVIQHPCNPRRPVAMWWLRTASQTPQDLAISFVYGDLTEWRIYDSDGRLVEVREHGLNRFPGTVVHADRPLDSFWNAKPFSDVVTNTVMVNLLMTFLSRLQYLQSELQVTYRGEPSDIAKGQSIGGDTVWAGPGDYGVLNLQAQPDFYIRHINQRITWLANCYGLAADAYTFEGMGESGAQIRFKRLPLDEQRRKRVKIWRTGEVDLYRLMALIAQQDHPLYKPDPMARFTVNHNETPLIEDPLNENRILDERVKSGRMSEVDVLMHDDPDLTREKAIAKMKRIADERKIRADIFRQINTPADPAEGPGKTPEENGREGGRANGGSAGEGGGAPSSEGEQP